MQTLEKQFHIHCVPGDVGRYCILPGDPGRVPAIAALFDDAHPVAQNREFNVWTGTLLGEKVTACSTGIGGPSAAIAMEELVKCGADTFLRTGTCGGIDLNVQAGDVVVATGAVRYEHTSLEYAPAEFPAVPDLELTNCLAEASRALSWKRLGVKASEMESAALFVVAAALHVRCGACFHVIWNQEREAAGLDQKMTEDTSSSVKVAVEAMKRVIRRDRGLA